MTPLTPMEQSQSQSQSQTPSQTQSQSQSMSGSTRRVVLERYSVEHLTRYADTGAV